MLALTHVPSPNIQQCQLTYVDHTSIDYELACRQHSEYCRTLEGLAISVRRLDVNLNYPDSTFVEDVAIVLDEVAILNSMGSTSRRGEPAGIWKELGSLRAVVRIDPPATIEGGDVLRVGRTLLVGLSSRTNRAGANALAQIVEPRGYQVVLVGVRGCLHLKTACTALPSGQLLVNPAWLDMQALNAFRTQTIPLDEPWSANTLPILDRVLLPKSHVRTDQLIRRLGFETERVDISEFAKAEGGVTCLSILVG